MSQFRFNEDFANNWKSGQIVTCEEKEDGYLIDKAALIEKDELLKHGEFITMNVQILGHMQSNGVDDLFMYDRDFQPGDTVQHFKGGFYKIVAIGTNTETEEKMVVYQSLRIKEYGLDHMKCLSVKWIERNIQTLITHIDLSK